MCRCVGFYGLRVCGYVYRIKVSDLGFGSYDAGFRIKS